MLQSNASVRGSYTYIDMRAEIAKRERQRGRDRDRDRERQRQTETETETEMLGT